MPCRSLCQFAVAHVFVVAAFVCAGCGTTRSTDTGRTATEQLLISDAIDRAVQSVNLQPLAGQSVFLDDSRLGDAVDRNYLVSTLRQHLLANGCSLRAERDQADFIVEARAGAIGTDRNDLLFGVPSMNVPQIFPVQPVAAAIPEIPIAKRRDQRGIAKIAVFAYHRETGLPVWQSGLAHQESSANDVWILGAGPFQRGTIYAGTEFAGKSIGREVLENKDVPSMSASVKLAQQRVFTTPLQLAKKSMPPPTSPMTVVPATHEDPLLAAHAAAPPAPDSAIAHANQHSTALLEPQPLPPTAAAAIPVPKIGAMAGQPQPAPADLAPLPQPRSNSPR
jgi:hypothetical protein